MTRKAVAPRTQIKHLKDEVESLRASRDFSDNKREELHKQNRNQGEKIKELQNQVDELRHFRHIIQVIRVAVDTYLQLKGFYPILFNDSRHVITEIPDPEKITFHDIKEDVKFAMFLKELADRPYHAHDVHTTMLRDRL